MRIAFIGNFEAPFSTENDRKWSLMMLGHTVVKFQEDKTTIKDLDEAIANQEEKIDLIIYSHTHGWEIAGLKGFFSRCKSMGIPTASVHLDRWAWLEREKDMGEEATWFTEYQFMADASPEAVKLYEKLRLKWFYLKPGLVARDCYIAHPDPIRFPHDIIFVGSKNYHPEYPFRKILVEWLHDTYGDRFGHWGGDGLGSLRGHDLNVALASAKIVIGDSCFGGRPNYVSDRYYETRGRGGLLLHPPTEGVDNVGVINYHAQNLVSLKVSIEYALQNYREAWRLEGFEHVKKNETYTNRMQEMLEIIFGKAK